MATLLQLLLIESNKITLTPILSNYMKVEIYFSE